MWALDDPGVLQDELDNCRNRLQQIQSSSILVPREKWAQMRRLAKILGPVGPRSSGSEWEDLAYELADLINSIRHSE